MLCNMIFCSPLANKHDTAWDHALIPDLVIRIFSLQKVRTMCVASIACAAEALFVYQTALNCIKYIHTRQNILTTGTIGRVVWSNCWLSLGKFSKLVSKSLTWPENANLFETPDTCMRINCMTFVKDSHNKISRSSVPASAPASFWVVYSDHRKIPSNKCSLCIVQSELSFRHHQIWFVAVLCVSYKMC